MCIRDRAKINQFLDCYNFEIPCVFKPYLGALIRWDVGQLRLGEYDSFYSCLLYTSDAADERSSVDLGGRRIIKKKNKISLVHTELPY